MRSAHLEHLGVEHRQTNAVVVLIDQNEVADMQRRQHRSRRNAKGLEKEAAQQKDDQNDREKSGGVLEPPRLTKRRRLQTAQIFADSSIAASERLAVGSFKSRRGFLGLPAALRQKYRALKNPKNAGDDRQNKKNKCEVHGLKWVRASMPDCVLVCI